MKILYAIQGTGNGHLSRAREIIPFLQKKGELDLLVSGIQSDIELPFKVKYKYHGMSFIFGKSGGIDFYRTYTKNYLRRFIQEVRSLPVKDYDIVISDFEPISSWACIIAKKPCIGLSNQCAVLLEDVPKAKHTDPIGKFILKNYAPCSAYYGFHFKKYNEHIYTPIIRKEIRELKVKNNGHYTVYLPAHKDEKIIKHLRAFRNIWWEVFSKHSKKEYTVENIHIRPIQDKTFLKSLAASEGVLCAAGFATPSEALFLKKKLLVIPMKQQFEQQCNAVALKKMGVTVIQSLKKKHHDKIAKWLKEDKVIKVDYPDATGEMIDKIFSEYASYQIVNTPNFISKNIPSPIYPSV